jgi:hypothetical protein
MQSTEDCPGGDISYRFGLWSVKKLGDPLTNSLMRPTLIGQKRSLYLSIDNNQLLAQQCIFDHQIGSVSHEVRPDPRNQGQWGGFGPIFDFLMKPKEIRSPEQ